MLWKRTICAVQVDLTSIECCVNICQFEIELLNQAPRGLQLNEIELNRNNIFWIMAATCKWDGNQDGYCANRENNGETQINRKWQRGKTWTNQRCRWKGIIDADDAVDADRYTASTAPSPCSNISMALLISIRFNSMRFAMLWGNWAHFENFFLFLKYSSKK